MNHLFKEEVIEMLKNNNYTEDQIINLEVDIFTDMLINRIVKVLYKENENEKSV